MCTMLSGKRNQHDSPKPLSLASVRASSRVYRCIDKCMYVYARDEGQGFIRPRGSEARFTNVGGMRKQPGRKSVYETGWKREIERERNVRAEHKRSLHIRF